MGLVLDALVWDEEIGSIQTGPFFLFFVFLFFYFFIFISRWVRVLAFREDNSDSSEHQNSEQAED